MCRFLDAMQRKGISHLDLLDYLAEYREWGDDKKFHRMMEDEAVIENGDRRLKIVIYEDEVTVTETSIQPSTVDEPSSSDRRPEFRR